MKHLNLKTTLATLAISTLASSAFAVGLEDAISTASANSHEIKRLKLESESNLWGERRAFSGFLPRLQLSGRHTFAEKFEQLPVEFGGTLLETEARQPFTSLSLNASYEIFSGLQTTNELQAARLAKQAADLRVARAEDQVRASVRTLFYRALGSQILVEVADQNIKTLEGHVSDVGSRVRSGVSTRFDSLRAEVQLEDARTEKVAAENNVAIARARLFEAIGIADDGKPLVGSLPEDFSRYENLNVKVQDVQREDRQALMLTSESVEKQARAAASHWYPRVSLFGSQTWYNAYNRSIWESDERFKPAYSVGLNVTWNLFDGGASVASQKQAAINEQIAKERLAQFDQSVPVELEESQRRLSYNVVNFKAKQSSVRKAEEAVRLARSGLRAGTRTNTEVLDAVVDLNRAKAATVRSQVEAIEALGQLELALGHAL